uniref:Uncharacterized protein n=1 Tax=Caenorhabditis japonica TaxID=281687 RepID=A0A8R1EUE9_CAEJA
MLRFFPQFFSGFVNRLSFIASEILAIRGTDVFQSLIVSCDRTKKIMREFLNDTTPMGHLVAGFFAKIVECLLSRQFTLTFELLRGTPFFEKCFQNINLGAIECLLENLVRIPNNSEGANAVKQWMIEENFFEKLVARMVESPNDEDKECLAEVFCETIRALRDKLYMVEIPEDALYDKAMEESLIGRIADNLLIDESCTIEELRKKSSLISSSAKILDNYIKTNYIRNCPSDQLEEIERKLLEERHDSFGMMRQMMDNDIAYHVVFKPDPEKIVEGIVSNRVPNMLRTILKDVQVGGSVWQPLLRLLIELCNTNHLPTHEKIAEGMRQLPFIKLIEEAKKLPRASVLHSLLVKVVALLLHSQFSTCQDAISPAAEHILTDGGLVRNVYNTACSFHPPSDRITSSGLRSFNQNLGDTIYRAKKWQSVSPQMVAILNVCCIFNVFAASNSERV